MKKWITLFCALSLTFQGLNAVEDKDKPGPLGSVPTDPLYPCPDTPFCCPGPGDYPTAPSHGTGCALTVAAMAVPFILVAGVAAVILITSDPTHAH